jgi:predicted nucleic acid-binding protein
MSDPVLVVADTTPLNYLVLIGQEHVLGALFDKVLIPEGMGHECLSPEVLSSICPLRPPGHSSNLSHHLIP